MQVILKGSSMTRCILTILCFLLCGVGTAMAEKENKGKIVYKYKMYEKFDLEDISVDGETGSPGDLSILNRYQRKFKNKLPYRKNFKPEIIMGFERIK